MRRPAGSFRPASGAGRAATCRRRRAMSPTHAPAGLPGGAHCCGLCRCGRPARTFSVLQHPPTQPPAPAPASLPPLPPACCRRLWAADCDRRRRDREEQPIPPVSVQVGRHGTASFRAAWVHGWARARAPALWLPWPCLPMEGGLGRARRSAAATPTPTPLPRPRPRPLHQTVCYLSNLLAYIRATDISTLLDSCFHMNSHCLLSHLLTASPSSPPSSLPAGTGTSAPARARWRRRRRPASTRPSKSPRCRTGCRPKQVGSLTLRGGRVRQGEAGPLLPAAWDGRGCGLRPAEPGVARDGWVGWWWEWCSSACCLGGAWVREGEALGVGGVVARGALLCPPACPQPHPLGPQFTLPRLPPPHSRPTPNRPLQRTCLTTASGRDSTLW